MTAPDAGVAKRSATTELRDRSMARRRGRGNDPDRTRADILEVATAHFAERGFSGGRVDEIAEQTNTSKRMLYYYFGSKEGLYRAVLARSYAEIEKLEQRIALDMLDPEEALRRLVEATFDFHVQHPDFVRLVMIENIHGGKHIDLIAQSMTRAATILDLLRRLLDRGVEAGRFRDGIDPLQLHLSISAACFYNVSNRYTVARLFGSDPVSPNMRRLRRASIVEMIERWVLIPS